MKPKFQPGPADDRGDPTVLVPLSAAEIEEIEEIGDLVCDLADRLGGLDWESDSQALLSTRLGAYRDLLLRRGGPEIDGELAREVPRIA